MLAKHRVVLSSLIASALMILALSLTTSPVFADEAPPATPQLVSTTHTIPTEPSSYSAGYTVWTVGWRKQYTNLFGIVVAQQDAYTQWRGHNGTIYAGMSLWQNEYTAPLYGWKDKGQRWNYVYSNAAESNVWVTFYSGIPTPWGSFGGSSFVSRIVTDVDGWGNSWAY